MNKNKGAVSVFLCAIFLSVIIAVGAAGDACSLAVSNSYAKRMNYLASKSVLAEYDKNLFQDYGLMAFNGGNYEIQQRIEKYIEQMARVGEDSGDEIVFFDLKLSGIDVDCSGSSLTDQEIFLKQITEHMKYKSVQVGIEKLTEYISGGSSIEEELAEAKSGFAAEKKEMEAAASAADGSSSETSTSSGSSSGSGSGDSSDGSASRKPVSLNNKSFNAEDEEEDRVLRSKRIIDSLPSGNDYEASEKSKYSLGKEEELMELGEDSSKMLESFYSSMSAGSEKLLLMEYIKIYFKNSVTAAKRTEDSFFTNEAEYILKGKCSDAKNKAAVKRDLFLLRTALNIAHIYADAEKSQLTLEAALATGAGPYAPAVQFVIAAAWAGAEANEDIDLLYSGGKVPFFKDKTSWKLDIDSIGGTKVVSSEYKGDKGLDYSAYLELMMLTCSKEKLTKRTMDLIQINMKGRHSIDFDLRNCIISFSVKTDFERISYLPSVLPGIIEDNAMSIERVFEY